MRTDCETFATIERLLETYTRSVLDAPLTPTSQKNYIDFADRFVRWIEGRYEPGNMKPSGPSTKFMQLQSQRVIRLSKAKDHKTAREP